MSTLDKECDHPTCEARTLRAYCIRCEINGQAQEHVEWLAKAAEAERCEAVAA